MIDPIAAGAAVVLAVLFLGAAYARDADRRLVPRPSRTERVSGVRVVGGRLFAGILGVIGAGGGWFVAGAAGALAGALAGASAPIAFERRRAAHRMREVDAQLIDAVAAIGSAVRSGRSLGQSLAVAAVEVGAPLGDLLREAADRASLGVSIDEVLSDLGSAIGGADARLVTGVLRLHRRTGGTLAASLDDLTRTLRARRDAVRELRSLTAQARLSATILGLLPLGFFLFLSVVARRDVEAAYRSAAGASAIAVGLALQGAAFVWIRRLLRVEDS
ncbi:MAG TPA: type II secretion system F family protein [Actinomycetota bacterium]|nr:type II secretion system F family protein [Actinomycetota bacterium]